MARLFAAHVAVRDLVQLALRKRQQPLQRRYVPFAPGGEEFGDSIRGAMIHFENPPHGRTRIPEKTG